MRREAGLSVWYGPTSWGDQILSQCASRCALFWVQQGVALDSRFLEESWRLVQKALTIRDYYNVVLFVKERPRHLVKKRISLSTCNTMFIYNNRKAQTCFLSTHAFQRKQSVSDESVTICYRCPSQERSANNGAMGGGGKALREGGLLCRHQTANDRAQHD